MHMAHQVTTNGFAVDPTITQLEETLGDLAGDWRSSHGAPEQQAEILQAYYATMEQLFQRGWDAGIANLGYEQTLPDEFMPAEYLRQMKVAASKYLQWTGTIVIEATRG
jgi:hypothetical protein